MGINRIRKAAVGGFGLLHGPAFHLVLNIVWAAVPAVSVSAQESGELETRSSWFDDHVFVSGTIEAEAAFETGTGRGQKFETIVEPEIEVELSDSSLLTIIPQLRLHPMDELDPAPPRQSTISGPSRRLLIGDAIDFEMRELYVQSYIRDSYLQIGKQQIVWGEADGLKVLDIVNPQRFREFILDDFEDSRIPLWSVKAEIPIQELTLQLVWIPDLTYHELPEEGSTYAFKSNIPQPPPIVPVIRKEFDRPNNPIQDSDIGARLSVFWKGWDLTFNYLYHYDDIPVLYRDISFRYLYPVVISRPGYERTHLVGGTFSNAFGNLTLRGEYGYSFHKYYPTESLTDSDGVHETDEFGYVIGLDWYGISETLISVQLFQSYLMDDAEGLLRDQVETNVSLLFKRDFLNDSLVFTATWLHNLNDNDGFIRPKLAYQYTDTLKIWAGVDYFYGTQNGLFGQFDNTDRVVFGAEWSF